MDEKNYDGNFDFINRPGWAQAGSVFVDGVEWYIHRYAYREGFIIRVTANGSARWKANYKLSWNGIELSGKDELVLREHRPALWDQVSGMLADMISPKQEAKPPRGRTFKATLGAKYHVRHEVGVFDGACWLLAERTGPHKGKWVTYKLLADRGVPNKAGYYLDWNGERLSKSRDVKLLMDHRPELYERVIAVLSGSGRPEQEDLWDEFIDNTGGN